MIKSSYNNSDLEDIEHMINLIKQIIVGVLEGLKDQEADHNEIYWHGVSLSDLNNAAKEMRSRYFVRIDESNCLVFHWTSNSGKQHYTTKCAIGTDGKLMQISPKGYYPNQWCDDADRFVEKINQKFVFK